MTYHTFNKYLLIIILSQDFYQRRSNKGGQSLDPRSVLFPIIVVNSMPDRIL